MQAYQKWPFQVETFFLSGLLSSILKICIRFVFIKLRVFFARSLQSTPEMIQQEFSESQFCQSLARTFWHFHVVPRALVWQIKQNIIEEKQIGLTGAI